MLSMSFEFRVALVLAFVVYAIGVLALAQIPERASTLTQEA